MRFALNVETPIRACPRCLPEVGEATDPTCGAVPDPKASGHPVLVLPEFGGTTDPFRKQASLSHLWQIRDIASYRHPQIAWFP
jgi:hypothetical protein